MKAIVDILGIEDDSTLVQVADHLLEGVILNNLYLLKRYPGRFPPLYESGVRFRAEPWATMPGTPGGAPGPGWQPLPPVEQFCPYPVLLNRRWGDCAQLCAARVAELRHGGEKDAMLRYYLRSDKPPGTPNRRRWYHVEVRRGKRGGGEIEDPSRRLDF